MQVFHHYNEDHNETSARQVVPYLLGLVPAQSAIDLGCGPGQWLSVLKQHGVRRIQGVDGAHVPAEARRIAEFLEADLRDLQGVRPRLNLPENRYDLAISLEVAEHLPPENAQAFVELLTDLSDCILFSAAIPGQTGEHHVNEQYPEYWRDLFLARGYVYMDPFRKMFWNNQNVNWWYRQNMFLVVKRELARWVDAPLWDGRFYVAPELFRWYVSKFKTRNKERL
ncbi:MAG: class I SAM-dependent methyltransferase [Pontiellaceae bacterium]|nr:class I SAM-dependent methyltransferase [Pontiellaceae bacterium]MBN2784143.1 class I SAM-dependent methyltransferase [Pontiellaceae bacterium]